MFSEQTYNNLIKRILENTKANGLDTREGSVSFNLLAPLTEELAKAYISMGDILNLAFIEDTFDEYLDKRVNEFGIYRKEGTKASGSIIVNGIDGTFIPNSTIVKCGELKYITVNDVLLPDEGTLYVEALDIGSEYNLPSECVFELEKPIDGVALLFNEEPFENGSNIETDEELRERFKYIIQNPRTSGNVNDYKAWALECDGVGRVKVYPLWNGNGTVKVLIIGSDNLPCSEETVAIVAEHIEEKRPIGATVTVDTPELLHLTFNINIKLDSSYSLDNTKELISTTLHDYINNLEDENIIFYKALSAVGDLECVDDIVDFKINNGQENIEIGDYHIPIIDEISVIVSEVV